MSVGRTLAKAFEFYDEFLGRLLIALVLLLGAIDLLIAALGSLGGNSVLRGLLVFVVTVLGAAWGQAAMVEDIRDRRDGKGDASILELFGRTWRAALHVAWATFCVGIAVGMVFVVATIVLALPLSFAGRAPEAGGVLIAGGLALVIAAYWSLVVPVIVIERQNRPGAFARSSDLVAPHHWAVTAVLGISFVVAFGIDVALGLLLAHGLHGWVGTWLGDLLDGLIFTSALVAVSTALYYELLEAARAAPRPENRAAAPHDPQPWAEDVRRLAR
jgi:hypothetical protein